MFAGHQNTVPRIEIDASATKCERADVARVDLGTRPG
jgi:hypothetical protein